MSAISLKSITGITSITTPAGVDNQLTLHTNDTTQIVKVTQSGIEAVGVATFQDIDVDGHTELDNLRVTGISTFGGTGIQNSVQIIHNSGYGLQVKRGSKFLDINGDWAASGSAALNAATSGIRLYYGASSDGIQFNTGTGDDKVRITGSGNVGIGTVDPETNLTIAKNATNQTVATIPTVRLTNLDTTAVATDIVGSYEFLSKDAHSENKVTGFMRNTPTDAGVNYDLTFGTIKTGDSNAVERLRIDSNGRVLIGHSSTPQAALSVAVVGSYGSSSNLTPFVYLCRDEDATSIGGNESLGQILFASKDGYRGAAIEAKAAGAWSGSSSDGYLVFKTTPDNTTVPTEKLRITSSGEVRIADGGFLTIDTNPASTYGISEALRIDDGAGVSDRGLQIFEYSHGGARYHRIQFNTNTTTNGSAYTYTQGNYGGSSSIEFDNSGHLSFFTDAEVSSGSTDSITPTERLLIDNVGNITFTGTTGNSSPRLTIKHNNADVEGEVIRFARTDLPTIRYHSIKARHSGNSTLNFVTFNVHDGGGSPYTSQAEVLRLRGDGKVGIGTNNPGHILDLYNADGTDCLKLNVSTAAGGSNKQNAIRFSVDSVVKAHMGVAVDAGRVISTSSANDFCLKTNQATDILFAPNGSIGLRLTSDGDMGLGTGGNTVSQRLDVRESNSAVFNASSNLPTIARLYNTSSTNGASAGIQLRTDNNNGAAAIQYIHAVNNSTNYSSDLVFSRRIGTSATYGETCRITNAGNLRFQANRGVEFHNYGTGTDIETNTLTDYEEGTFTPLMYGNTTGGSSNTVSGLGYYTKVGDMCTMTLVFSNKNGTGLPANEQLRIASIPFTFANGPGNQTSAVPFTYKVAFNTSHTYTFIGGNNVSYLRGYNSRDSSTWQPWMTDSWRVSQFYLYVNMTFKTL